MLRKKLALLLLVALVSALITPVLLSLAPNIALGETVFASAYDSPPALSGRVVILDPGHGVGSTNIFRGYDEQAAMLDLALRIKPLLEAQGATVLLTRSTETNVLLPARCAMINIWALEAIRYARLAAASSPEDIADEIEEIDSLIDVMQSIIDEPRVNGIIYMNTPFDPQRSIHPVLERVLELQDDPEIADRFLVISLHSNATARPINTSINGAKAFFISNAHQNTRNYFTGFSHSELSREFGVILLNHIETVGFRNLGARIGNYFIIREHNVPAVLAENGFHTNDADRARLQSAYYLQRLAYAYLDAIVEYFSARPQRSFVSAEFKHLTQPELPAGSDLADEMDDCPSSVANISDPASGDATTNTPAPPPQPKIQPPLGDSSANTLTASRRNSVAYIDGARRYFHTFDIGGQNHIRVRDLAYLLSGTENRFNISWNASDRAIHLTAGSPYTSIGSELSPLTSSALTATTTTVRFIIGGEEFIFSAFNYAGDNFFRLRDFTNILGINLGWNPETSSILLGTGDRQVSYSLSVSDGLGSRVRIIDPDRPAIAITFDDGPAPSTSAILDVLRDHDVPATFFVLGRRVAGGAATIQRMNILGHEIANHSWSHPNFTSISNARIIDEIVNTNNAIAAITGVEPTLLRVPFGSTNSRVSAVAQDLGLPLIRWSIDTRDWESRNANSIYNIIMQNVSDRDIILLHDIHQPTAQAIERVIPSLVARGYQLLTVSELMCLSGITLMPGVEYFRGR